jgi:flavin reductase (DIM6/NTAB) family NADH-FMN oxidoreductase RutF
MIDINLQDDSTVTEELAEKLVPESVAWVSTCGVDGEDHLTPFTYFGALSFNPPIIALSTVGAGFTTGGDGKAIESDSNLATSDIYTTEEFVINFPTDSTANEIHSTIQKHRQLSDFFETSGIERKPAHRVSPPRLAGAIFALECRLRDDIAFGDSALLIGDITEAHVHEKIADEAFSTSN